MPAPWKKSYDKTREYIKRQRHHLANKGLYSQSYGFSSSHLQMWELDPKEDRGPKNWCFWTVVLEKTLESPLNSKEIKPVSTKGNEPCRFLVSTDAEAEALTLATWWEEPTHWKRPRCWESLTARGEGGDKGWEGWMASVTQWTRVWANSGR